MIFMWDVLGVADSQMVYRKNQDKKLLLLFRILTIACASDNPKGLFLIIESTK
jgi:hypothetical protein